jgi:bacillithiol biosynthesis cysteine-adding enzyme BshC
MRHTTVPVEAIPHASRLLRDYLREPSRVSPFYPYSPLVRDWMPAVHGTARASSQPRTGRVAEVLAQQNRAWGAGEKALANIERLRRGAAAVVTGQQVVLFGGQLMAYLKALTAIKVADEATRAGQDTVPVFWLATEDHDRAEVSALNLYGPGWELRRLSAELPAAEGTPVGRIHLGPEIERLAAEAAALLGGSEAADILHDAYTPGTTLGDAYARLFGRLFAEFGLVLMDNSDAELHRIAQPLFSSALERAEALNAALLARGRELDAAGYHAQVKVSADSTLLFVQQEGARIPLRRSGGDFVLGARTHSRAEMAAHAAAHPEDFSANALLRPVLQDYLLPTLAYVGGPAEVAYFAQCAVVYEELLGRVTPVLPRASATLIEPRIAAWMERYQITLPEAFSPEAEFRRRLGARALPAGLQAELEGARCTAGDMEGPIRHELRQLDPTLEAAAAKAFAKIRHQFDRLERKAARAMLRRHAELDAQSRKLANALFPRENLQEREIAGIHFLGRAGLGLLRRLYEALDTHAADHHVYYL